MSYEIIPDEKLRKALPIIYNVWFRKWLHKSGYMTDHDWNQCLKDADIILDAGREHNYKLLESIIIALINELHARDIGGYPKEIRMRSEKKK